MHSKITEIGRQTCMPYDNKLLQVFNIKTQNTISHRVVDRANTHTDYEIGRNFNSY